ncbi:helix-turn-helix transcriptional regulator, partial [Streptomyces lunaelactis]|uniref:helix-turn-helix transcriptional regulator n=1 Tax=Streptomyces lunaelactis TaxID=1535768 RepID=UPI0015856C77
MTQSTGGSVSGTPLPSPKERRRLREANSLTEEQVATAVGVTRATLRAWETGRTNPRGHRRDVYAQLLAGFEAEEREEASATAAAPAAEQRSSRACEWARTPEGCGPNCGLRRSAGEDRARQLGRLGR